ncbi:hypothetical protein COT48_04890 [Candidatus Woesearchaeota archaeon CG08_land_8_20_14_0_20_47_9]|nr:MAG: hypothetical protein AUJ69_01850 [Candidatus Woesearchaeota archaeon CG1_02_47_18]PIN72320.1 MAG: hypothetical protein COV22_03520 [Candidatus Woesearchaeota archaeon CG10_big_fil_rev_8_21_14_0_10_47_5]PIO03437.1 MAG: hypothetical protein COT48_04890 [Candidatus Woesearchaeota archaeon CG08_land_8_20_14_0_20_47_9]HII29760.1 hypothetical protein [Candidatus Woesearchaeota archaeon]
MVRFEDEASNAKNFINIWLVTGLRDSEGRRMEISITKRVLKALLPRTLFDKLRFLIILESEIDTIKRNQERMFNLNYESNINSLGPKEIFRINEFKVYSQNGEDGLIQYIFSRIGICNYRFVEFGVQTGEECNTRNLSWNFGWSGLLMDAEKGYVKEAKTNYRDYPKVSIVDSFITKDNINKTLSDNGFKGEIDLLSIDIDGNDYWVWQEISIIDPRVVVIEYNASLGLRSLTVKYDESFVRHEKHPSGWYHGHR